MVKKYVGRLPSKAAPDGSSFTIQKESHHAKKISQKYNDYIPN